MATSGGGILVSMAMVSSHLQLKKWLLQKIPCIIVMRWFRKNIRKRRRESSPSPADGHLQLEASRAPSSEEQTLLRGTAIK